MLHKTLSEAQDVRSVVSWKHHMIFRVTLKDGRTFFRTTKFDTTVHRCKRCRKAANQCRAGGKTHYRAHSSGHTCTICGNPYAGFSRAMRLGPRLSPDNPYAPNTSSYSGGKLH